jgi:hypothetical protein
VPLELSLHANGAVAARATIRDAGWQTVTFNLPAGLGGRMARFALHCARTFVPADSHGTADRRALGVMVGRIWAGIKIPI